MMGNPMMGMQDNVNNIGSATATYNPYIGQEHGIPNKSEQINMVGGNKKNKKNKGKKDSFFF